LVIWRRVEVSFFCQEAGRASLLKVRGRFERKAFEIFFKKRVASFLAEV
jgi:hypothetical protein